MKTISDSGADLAEFAGGLGELLRALIMNHYGAAPEGLPESTRRLIDELGPRLGPEDALRMLKLLGEAEAGLRRSANPRIVLETLLLRWALMDRAVDLRAMLAGGSPSGPVKPITVTAAPKREPRARSPEPGPQSPAVEAHGPEPKARSPEPANTIPAGEIVSGPWALGSGLSPESLSAAWSDVLATASRQSPMLGQALGHATPRLVGPGKVELAFGADSALFHDGVARQLASVETILGATLGAAVTVQLTGSADAVAAPERRSKRLSPEAIRNERLALLRSKDPALDAAANALDLELVDDD
jgi:DNA polymerase-3 subunit gamma/tau